MITLGIKLAVVAAMCYRAYTRNSLTASGITAAAVIGLVNALHPWSVFLAALVVFYSVGTFATKVLFSN